MSIESGGAGSGYIGNSLLSNKKMVGYNVPTSSAEETKTESINEASESPVSGKPKIGNGHAKIKLLRELYYNTIALPIDNQVILKPSDGSDWTLSNIPTVQKEPYMYDSSCMIVTGQMNCAELQESDNVYSYPYNNVSYNNTRYYYYLGGTKHIRGGKVKYRNTSGNHFPRFYIKFYDTQTWSAVGTLVSSSSGEITQDYIDVDLLFDVEANYLEIRGAADGFDFKDLKLLYE